MEMQDSVELTLAEALEVFKEEPGAGNNIEVTSEAASADELLSVFK